MQPGTRLGAYEIAAQIGAGGMGEVYRARDTRLKRDVALKILPAGFATDLDRLARFQREAEVLASLNHPNIAAIYGLEEENGIRALVMELVEGPTVADRIAQGPIPVDEALPLAKQIAEALEVAHEQGIIHRDLKPANVKVRPDGVVKVLDFGLAKALDPSAAATDASQSPTITSPAMVTGVGVLLGTAAYMSPEQARGKTVDRRADIWAFGCVLFEMLTGARAFNGVDVTDCIVAVVSKEPDWAMLPSSVPLQTLRVLRRCLSKDPRERLRDIGDAKFDLIESLAPQAEPEPTVVRSRRRFGLLVAAVASLGLVGVGLTAANAWRNTPAPVTAQLIAMLPEGVTLPLGVEHPLLALSPDGKRLVFVGDDHGIRRLYSREIASLETRPVPGTEGAMDPFFAPDGAITFFAGGAIRKVPLSGGAPRALHAATEPTVNRGATWVDGTSIVYAASPNSGLSRGMANEERPGGFGEWSYITRDVTAAYGWPAALPDGRAVLFTHSVGSTPDESNISLLSIGDQTERRLVTGGTAGRFSPTGHVLFARGGELHAVPFDSTRLEAIGPETKLLDRVVVEPNGAAQFSVSANGVLAYIAGPALGREHELVWVDRQGHATPFRDEGREYSFPRLSPDGSKLAVDSPTGSNEDVWILDLRLGSFQRVTTAPGEDFEPVWSPDGTRLAISSESAPEEGPRLAITRSPNFELEFPLQTPGVGNWEMPTSWSPDGKWIAITRHRASAASDVEMFPTTGAAAPVPFVADAASEMGAMFSPTDAYVAYVSDVTGREEVYVRAFPGTAAATLISTNGGTEPVWSRDGSELFYREGDTLKSVAIGRGAPLQYGAPRPVFEGRYEHSPYGGRSANYDVSPDGKRFLMLRRKNVPTPAAIHIVLNWPALLRQ
jgi:eukaryotic-like serine/threonine-protein kinase